MTIEDESRIEGRAKAAMLEREGMIGRGQVMNHTGFKLSDLDMEIIRSLPQGGSWKDLPAETVGKSRRLTNIVRTGGRTTLYGRMDYDKPSYTISTYFNRPNSGTFVHPVHDRMISPREAARLQSFKDGYYFVGPKAKVLKQIGNAVPPLMAMHIARRIREETGFTRTMGLFSGAGGLAAGFKEAGMRSVLETDIDMDACVTCKANNPEIPVLCADITEGSAKRAIVDRAVGGGVEIVCGGPPCQGFSLAGRRFVDDPRNQLFRHYADIVGEARPKMFVFENVVGLLSMSDGQAYREITDLFSSLGYGLSGQVLNSVHYGVPQKRRRVIVIGVRDDLGLDPADMYPPSTTGDEASQVTVRDAISDLENVRCGDGARYDEGAAMGVYAMEMRSMLRYGSHAGL